MICFMDSWSVAHSFSFLNEIRVIFFFELEIRLIPIMLELDVVPERSLGCEQWEFILGKFQRLS